MPIKRKSTSTLMHNELDFFKTFYMIKNRNLDLDTRNITSKEKKDGKWLFNIDKQQYSFPIMYEYFWN